MWIMTVSPRGSNFYEADSLCGNKTLISDSCDTVIYARSQGSDGHQLVAQRGRDTFLVGPAPVRGVTSNMEAQMADIAKQLGAVVLA